MFTKKSFPIYPLLIIFAIIALGVYIWLSTKPVSATNPGKKLFSKSFIVKTIRPTFKAIPVSLEEVGTVEAAQTVSIIPQISGILKKINFEQGAHVKVGQVLFEIDDAVARANLDQANANLQRDQAQLDVLKSTAARYESLAKLEYVTRQQAEEAKAAAAGQAGTLAADLALLKQAEIQLSYTQIISPIRGKTGTITVHVGDLINANSATPLVVINRMNPVLVSFSIGQDELPSVLKYKKAGTLAVKIIKEDTETVLAEGNLAIINNSVNNQTGTVQVKAEIPNPDFSLWPGQLVTVKLILTIEPKALVIPDSAVQMGQNGHYVYVISHGKAVIKPITVARQVAHQAVIAKGLTTNDIIIQEVPPGLTEGMAVQAEKQQTGRLRSQR